MDGNHRLLARLQGAIEIVRQDDLVGNELERPEGIAQLRRQVHQNKASAALAGGWLDLGEAVDGGRVDAGDEAKIEQQEAAVGRFGEQRLDL